MSFEQLLRTNVNDKTEKKKAGYTTLTYLSWSFAWSEFVKVYPEATYEIIKNEQGLPYFMDEAGAMSYTKVTANNITHEMWLPVMDGANKPMRREAYEYNVKSGKKKCEALNMFDVNKTVMRCLVKNLAMFGLGLYIYNKEDIPEPEPIQLITKDQIAQLENLIVEAKADRVRFLIAYQIKDISEMPMDNFLMAYKQLNKKIDESKAEAKK